MRLLLRAAARGIGTLFLTPSCPLTAAGPEWPAYLGDEARSHYSPLDQINPQNVATLAPAWTFRDGSVGPNDRAEMQCNPLMVGGVLYITLPGATLVALDAATGVEKWRFDPISDDAGRGLPTPPGDQSNPRAAAGSGDPALQRGGRPPRGELTTNRNRGVAYWASGDDRRILHSAGHYLFAIDARTGRPIAEFGDRGRLDFNQGLGRDPARMSLHSATTPGAIFENLFFLSIRTNEGPGPSAPGHIRAFDVRTGKVVWTFHTIPQPGEFGYDTWPPEAWKYAGGTNCWAGMAVDAERALLFVPTGSPTFDFWGGNRVGQNLFGNSLICLDARTGRRKWHFQFVHHDIWDRDLPAPPNLVTIRRPRTNASPEGTTSVSSSSKARTEAGPPSTEIEEIPAVAQVTKSGHVFVFHRETGEPLFPIEEVAVPSSDIPGEVTWPTQPLPTKPAAFSRQSVTAQDLTTRTPQAHRAALEHFARLRPFVPFQPPSREGSLIIPGLDGGAEWGGAAVAPDGVLYINSSDLAWILQLVETQMRSSTAEMGRNTYTLYCAGCHGLDRSGNAPQNIPALIGLKERMPRADVLARIAEGKGSMPAFAFVPPADREELANYLLEVFKPRAPRANVAAASAAARNAPPGERSYFDVPFVRTGTGRWLDAEGYPNVQPPWGWLNAIDLNTGDYRWRVPLGDYPELAAKGVPTTGTDNYGGPVVTGGGLIFIAATRDEMFRAFDRETGRMLWSVKLPAAGYATPCTYASGGRQYVVIACGGGKLGTKAGDTYMAFALPGR